MAGRACTRSISWTRSRSTSSWPPRRACRSGFLIPALQGAIKAFPFNVKGFHVDNGSEFVNHKVAALLNRLHVEEFTKSRPRRCNDNALVESTNASVVRRYLGHDHIPRHHEALVDRFLRDVRRAVSAARRHLRAARPSGPGPSTTSPPPKPSTRLSPRSSPEGSDAATPSHERTAAGAPRKRKPANGPCDTHSAHFDRRPAVHALPLVWC